VKYRAGQQLDYNMFTLTKTPIVTFLRALVKIFVFMTCDVAEKIVFRVHRGSGGGRSGRLLERRASLDGFGSAGTFKAIVRPSLPALKIRDGFGEPA
jgi:hypothetical protein